MQPVMVTPGPPLVSPDPLVRRVRPDEIDILWPACVAMFTEEVGVSPVTGDGGASYRARLEQLIRGGRAFARIENGQVVFKAEIGAVTPQVCQVQGVWVRPQSRGRGLAAPGMAAVVIEAARSIAPLVSLYVNDFNAPARAAYRRVGFTETGPCRCSSSPGGDPPEPPAALRAPLRYLAVVSRGRRGQQAPRGPCDRGFAARAARTGRIPARRKRQRWRIGVVLAAAMEHRCRCLG